MGPKIGHVVHARARDLSPVQALDDLRGAQFFKRRKNDHRERGAIFAAPGVAVKARVRSQPGVLQHHLAKRTPLALILQAQHDRTAVPCGKRPVGIDAGMRGRAARRWRCSGKGVVQRVAHPLGQRLQHRDIDVAAVPGPAAQQQGRQNAAVGIHRRRDVGDRVARLARRLGRAGDRQKARLALDQQVVGLFVAVRAVLAVARDIADDQRRMRGAERLPRQPHARRRTGRQVLHQHIGLAQQLHQRGQCRRLLEVQRQALLGTVGPDKVRGLSLDARVVGARKVPATGTLDLDHARAKVGQLARAEGRGDGVFQGDDGDTVEGSGHKFPCLLSSESKPSATHWMVPRMSPALRAPP